MTTVSSVERILAEDAIRRALVEYCRGVDRGDATRALEACHPDGIDHHGTWDGVAATDLPSALARLVARTRSTVHSLGPSTFDWRASREVVVESDVLALHETVDDDGRRIEHLHGRYLDLFTLRDGQWQISERTFVHDLDFLDERGAEAYPRGIFAEGAHGNDDPSATHRAR